MATPRPKRLHNSLNPTRSTRWAFGRWVQSRRHVTGRSSAEVAAAIGVGRSFIQLVETGDRLISDELMPAYAKVLEVSEKDLRIMQEGAVNGLQFTTDVDALSVGVLFWCLMQKPLDTDTVMRILRHGFNVKI